MKLIEKLNSISKNQILEELDYLLDHANVSVSWNGRRMVQIRGYEGTIEIDLLAEKYLQAKPFDSNESVDLQERLDCYRLWGRVKKLYENSEKQIKETWMLKYLIAPYDSPVFDTKHPEGFATITIICDDFDMNSTRKNSIFAFNTNEFQTIWPNLKAVHLLTTGKWWASKEMIENILKTSPT